MAGCAKCGHNHVARDSCENRDCPRCQGPAEHAQTASWIKKAVCGLLFGASAETVLTIGANPGAWARGWA
jgi:hypothetical protein